MATNAKPAPDGTEPDLDAPIYISPWWKKSTADRKAFAKDWVDNRIPILMASNQSTMDSIKDTTLLVRRADSKFDVKVMKQWQFAQASAWKPLRLWRCTTLDAGFVMKALHPKWRVGIVHTVSHLRRGGDFLEGGTSNEAQTLIRTSLWPALGEDLYRNQEQWNDNFVVYTPNVGVYRSAPTCDLPANEHFLVDMISINPHHHPMLDAAKEYVNMKDAEGVKRQLEHILHAAIIKKVDCLVVDALGCELHGHPPDRIAEIMVAVFESFDWRDRGITEIVVAVEEQEFKSPIWLAFIRAFRKCRLALVDRNFEDYADSSILALQAVLDSQLRGDC